MVVRRLRLLSDMAFQIKSEPLQIRFENLRKLKSGKRLTKVKALKVVAAKRFEHVFLFSAFHAFRSHCKTE